MGPDEAGPATRLGWAPTRLPELAQIVSGDPAALTAVYQATWELLRTAEVNEVTAIACALVARLGGTVAHPSDLPDPREIAVDLSLGATSPVVPTAEPGSPAWWRLASLMPGFMEDARTVVHELRVRQVMQHDVAVDPLTTVGSRRVGQVALAAAVDGDVVVLVDLDHFKDINDTYGHGVGDQVLSAFGTLLRASVRTGDTCSRYGGEEFLVIMSATTSTEAQHRVTEISRRWKAHAPVRSTFSAGVAVVSNRDPAVALGAADGALYRAKAEGRDRIFIADPDKHPDRTTGAPELTGPHHA